MRLQHRDTHPPTHRMFAHPPTHITHALTYLDIPMNQMPVMHDLHPLQHLVRQLQDRAQGKPPPALVKQVFQRIAQQLHHHHIEAIMLPEIMHLPKPGTMLQFSVHLVLVPQLWATRAMLLELDRDLLAGRDVFAQVDITKGPSAQPPRKAVLIADDRDGLPLRADRQRGLGGRGRSHRAAAAAAAAAAATCLV